MYSTQFESAYHSLNPEQKKAVDTIEGPVLVVAGPGTGKTQLLAVRVANILDKTDTLPSSILCLSFTESACKNMRDRLVSMIGRDAHKVAIHTFHSFGSEVINQNPEHFFFGAGYQATDNLTQIQILRTLFKDLKQDNPLNSYHEDHDFTFLKDTLSSISALKKGGISPSNFQLILESNKNFLDYIQEYVKILFENKISLETVHKLPKFLDKIESYKSSHSPELTKILEVYPGLWEIYQRELDLVIKAIDDTEDPKKKTKPLTEWKSRFLSLNNKKELVFKDTKILDKQFALASLYQEYQKQLHKQGLYDFEDMLLEVVKAFENPSTCELKYNYQEKYQYVLVDEFQDTNGVQIKLLDNLLDNDINEGFPNILAVGDDDQAIFKFQGASVENMIQFKEKYPLTATITLTKNYRSTQSILDLSAKIIDQSTERLSTIQNINKNLVSMKQEYTLSI